MNRTLIPNVLTTCNLFCGFVAIRYIVEGNFVPAAWLIVLGAVLDKMDGFLARTIGQDSSFGVEFDSLVDVCTFGVAPALMIYYSHMESNWGLALAFVYLLFGAIRLARFNVLSQNSEERGEFYMGLPIPIAAIVLTQYVVFTQRTWDPTHSAPLAAALVVLLSFLMISRLGYDPMPNFRGTSFSARFKQFYFLGSISLTIYSAEEFFFPLTLFYLSSGIYRWASGVFQNEVTQHA
jgi:CDP-diacylglycerol---serine O-phosphatidyltransferase